MLENYRWYRKWKGGNWYRVVAKYVTGIPDWWTQEKPTNSNYGIIEQEFYTPFTDSGNVSDGYHTFDELYDHRQLLFILAINESDLKSWKSRRHEDGTMYPEYFIAGLDLPTGMITYHLQNKFWYLVNCIELPFAPKWDGHTPDDVLNRIDTYLKGVE